ncbi:uncharacterized protein LOC115728066 [Rhodamnia argentea]|uniref:Uncharacterized protein LOC115728066 n=1 Tax=Rhodamnia argentea TaxID=178133 RepID=A0A8B8MVW9_9MYRT|nr:uncharacterized protein LOC115728066 [Rhodamnia argentea]
MAQTRDSFLELRVLLLWLERAAFLEAYMLSAMFPMLGFMLSLAFQVLYWVRSVIQSDNPRSERDSWVLFIPEHVAAVLLEAYSIFGRPPCLATMALLLFGGSSMVRLSLAWWAKHPGEVAKVWATIFDEGTKKTREGNSVAMPPPVQSPSGVSTKNKKKPVVSKVEQEAARWESPEKETAVVAETNPTPAKAAAGLEEKTSEVRAVDKLDETAKPAAGCCEDIDENALNALQATCGSGEPPLGQPQDITPGDDSCPSQEPTYKCVPPAAPGAGMYGCLQGGIGEYWGGWGGGYYASPWASEREYLLEELDKANAAANDYYQVAAQYSIDVHQLTMENHQLFSKLEDLTARHDIDREEQVLLRESFKALCDRASYLDEKTRDEVSCAEYYKECCLEYSEGKGLLQEENAWLQAEVEDLRKWLDKSKCELQALENAQPGPETGELRKQLDESECKRQVLEEENAQLGAEMEELRKHLDESECKREDLEEENAQFVAESENLRKYLDKCECKREALEEVNAQLTAETEELWKLLVEYEGEHKDPKEENAQLVDKTEGLRNYLDNSERKRVALEKAKAQLRAETEELMKRLEESERKRQALEEEKAGLDTNLSGAIALCEVYCFVLKYLSLFNGVNS